MNLLSKLAIITWLAFAVGLSVQTPIPIKPASSQNLIIIAPPTKPADPSILGPTWAVHSYGVEQQIIDGLPAWKQFGGHALLIWDYAGSLARPEIAALAKRCDALGINLIPGALLAGMDLPEAQRSDPALWRPHVDAIRAWKAARPLRYYSIDSEQWWGMNACEAFSPEQSAQCVTAVRWAAKWCEAEGVTLIVYGPAARKWLQPGAKRLTDLLWQQWPDGALLADYVADAPVHPLANRGWLMCWGHPFMAFGVPPSAYRAAAQICGVIDQSIYYGPPWSVIAALQQANKAAATQASAN